MYHFGWLASLIILGLVLVQDLSATSMQFPCERVFWCRKEWMYKDFCNKINPLTSDLPQNPKSDTVTSQICTHLYPLVSAEILPSFWGSLALAHANIMHAALAYERNQILLAVREVEWRYILVTVCVIQLCRSKLNPVHPSIPLSLSVLLSPAGTGWLRLTDRGKKSHWIQNDRRKWEMCSHHTNTEVR